MTLAVEIPIPVSNYNQNGSLTNSVCAAHSQGTIDTTPIFSQTLQGVYTGSWPGNVNTWDYKEVLTTQGFYTGSWLGNVNSWDQYQVTFSGTNKGLWPGNANNWDTYQVPDDSHDKSVISNDSVNATQGAGSVEWNHFPFPPEEPEPVLKVRDLTRFQKAYSFTRQQPVRIRLYRK